MTTAWEVNFDGIVGPTHNYAGLSFGNNASQLNRRKEAKPRAAALEGLSKMKYLADLGLRQAVLPPQDRPHIRMLRQLGYGGSDAQVLQIAKRDAPEILAACCSASSMWAANAATVSPSADTRDHRVHFTPANLCSNFHRSLEAPFTQRLLERIFKDESKFKVHSPLPSAMLFSDEGAANHTRLTSNYDTPGIEVFTFGRHVLNESAPTPNQHVARQTLEACRSIATRHQLRATDCFYLHQNPETIDAGVFHNDVIAVGNRNTLMYHEAAYINAGEAIDLLADRFHGRTGQPLDRIIVREDEVPLADAVSSYLFNSQLVNVTNEHMTLITPIECSENPRVAGYLEQLIASSNSIGEVIHVDVRQSMRNGGGPACLRLRVVMTEDELATIHQSVILTDHLYTDLVSWVNEHYRPSLHPDDLDDPELLVETRTALDALTKILDLPGLYE